MDKKPAKQPKKITPSYLENAALYYLQRYATSAENLRAVLTRKVKRSCAFHQTEPEAFYPAIDALLERYKSSGLLNDEAFARAKTATLRRKGQSKRGIEAKLAQKGLGKEDIAKAILETDESEHAELEAAIALAKRKKLGQGNKDPKKEMAVLARAGFSYEIARKALRFEEEDA